MTVRCPLIRTFWTRVPRQQGNGAFEGRDQQVTRQRKFVAEQVLAAASPVFSAAPARHFLDTKIDIGRETRLAQFIES